VNLRKYRVTGEFVDCANQHNIELTQIHPHKHGGTTFIERSAQENAARFQAAFSYD
jgi:hypothetical protein